MSKEPQIRVGDVVLEANTMGLARAFSQVNTNCSKWLSDREPQMTFRDVIKAQYRRFSSSRKPHNDEPEEDFEE